MAANKTVKVTFSDGVMMFGNSYKPWVMQYDEYIWMRKNNGTPVQLKSVETSHSKWVSWGGLKWCPEEGFQHQLNREGCQDNEPDNPKPRKYSKMKFKIDNHAFKKAKELLDRASVLLEI
ncbi:spore protein H [Viridibacillus arvi]|uniref:spore protein H n=1 Tax=Viridibacillus arvi TaxID=263475 RepID=UPI0034CE6D7C